MGMFDSVNYECDCPVCGARVTDFQSKEGECDLLLLEPKDVDYFYSSCDKCKTWIDIHAKPATEREYVMTHVTKK